MSVDYGMKIVRYKNGKKEPEVLCEVVDYNKIKAIIEDLEETYNYHSSLKSLMDKDDYYFYTVITLQNIEDFIIKKKKDIEKCKNKISEVKENLKAYYQSGNHNENIENDLREELSIYEECINPDSDEDNDIYGLKVAESIQEDIIFVNDYLKPLSYEETLDGLYIILEGSC